MSNAMSRSKASWKGALLATAASAALAPLANAAIGTMSLSLSLNPLGVAGPKTTEYIAPTGADTIYVYGTVTGTSVPNASEFDGLQYAYFNVNSTVGTVGLGAITAVTPNAALGFNGNGSQTGTITAPTAVGSNLVVGSTTDITQVSKPRAAAGVYSPSSGTGDGTNVIVNGNSVSFLLETLTYTPAFTPKKAVAGTADTISFSLSMPPTTIAGPATDYPTTNYFTDLGSKPGVGVSPSAANTGTAYTVGGTSVNLIDAEQGDVNLDGTVNGGDLAIVASNFNKAQTGYKFGDLNGDGTVNGGDLALIASNFNVQYSTVTPFGAVTGLGSSPFTGLGGNASATAELAGSAVPEPASLGMLMLAGAGMLRRRKV